MMRHLTEDELIKFEFGLSEDRADRISAHLKECAQCREKLEQLKSRFASLDLLREEISVSDELIAQTISQAKSKVTRNPFSPHARYWIGAIAAVFVMGGVFLINYIKQGEFEDGIAQKTTPMEIKDIAKIETLKPFARKTSLAKLPSVTATAGDVLEEKPPFAPASAIELVVLPRRENVQLTIYNSADLTLVRERRNLTMKKGWNWLQFMWANTLIDPTSLSLEPLANKDKIDIQQLVYPARLKDIGRWLIRSQVDGQVPFEITYLTSGLQWRAFYMGTLSADEKMMQLSGYVRVDNSSGEDYENARTRLIVGKVHQLDRIADLARRQYPYDRPGLEKGVEVSHQTVHREISYPRDWKELNGHAFVDSLERKEIKKEGLSEYFLYTIEGTETIADKWGKRLPSFDTDDIPVESLYKYEDGRWNDRTIRFVKFANDTDHELGKTPIPEGNVRIYRQTDSDKHLAYVGGTDVKYIPVDDEVELNLGPARQVVVEPKLMNFATANYSFNRKKEIDGWDEIRSWKIKVTNARGIPVKVEIKRNFDTTYWQIENTGEYTLFEKEDFDTVKYTLDLAPESSKAIEYVLTTYHGTRRDDWTPTQW